MRSKFPVRFRAWCVALGLCVGSIVHAAEPHPLMGATREQVLTRYGEPRSTLVGGGREVLFYGRERLTLRNGVVVDVERLAAEPVRRPGSAPAPAPVVAPAAPAATEPAPAAVPPAEAPVPRTAAPLEPAPRQVPPTPAPDGVSVAPAPGANAAETTPPAPAPAPEPRLEIKRVLPPGASAPRPPTSTAGSARPAPAPVPPQTESAPKTAAPPPAAPIARAPVEPAAPVAPVAADAGASSRPAAAPAPASLADAPAVPADEPSEAPVQDKLEEARKKAAQRAVEMRSARRRLEEAASEKVDPTAAFFSTRTYVFACVIIVGGAGYLLWRRRQREIELAATAVSHSPFSAPVAANGGTQFTLELIAKLEWKHFEELVAAYYAKTGVVATRTKSGPSTPVHIKISWKGEPRPFALVQCIAQPQGLVDAKPIQELTAVLMAEDIRRGYVVTSGKFSVPARDFAEEKHLTLLPGEIFVEKLNALPDAARAEIMQQVTAGDYSTPACPKCEAKMVRADEPGVWRCAAHADQRIVAR